MTKIGKIGICLVVLAELLAFMPLFFSGGRIFENGQHHILLFFVVPFALQGVGIFFMIGGLKFTLETKGGILLIGILTIFLVILGPILFLDSELSFRGRNLSGFVWVTAFTGFYFLIIGGMGEESKKDLKVYRKAVKVRRVMP